MQLEEEEEEEEERGSPLCSHAVISEKTGHRLCVAANCCGCKQPEPLELQRPLQQGSGQRNRQVAN